MYQSYSKRNIDGDYYSWYRNHQTNTLIRLAKKNRKNPTKIAPHTKHTRISLLSKYRFRSA